MNESTTTAVLVAVIIILAKVIEGLWSWYSSRNGRAKHAKLHPETTRQLREVYENVNLLMGRDISAMQSHLEKMAEHLAAIGKSLEKIVEVQERYNESCRKTASTLLKIETRSEIEEAIKKRLVPVG